MWKELAEEIDTAAALERSAITSALEGEAKKLVETMPVNSANNDATPQLIQYQRNHFCQLPQTPLTGGLLQGSD